MAEELTAWLSTPDRWIGVDYEPESLSIGQDDKGGFTEAELRLKESINSKDPILGPMTRLVVTDTRTARVAWEGYLDIPGRTKGDQGDVWDIGAIGPKARLTDRKLPYVVIDTDQSAWREQFATNPGMGAQQSGFPDDEDEECFLLSMPQGIPVGNNSRVTAIYRRIANADQQIGGFRVTHVEGFNNADYELQVLARSSSSGVEETPVSAGYSTTPATVSRSAGGSSPGFSIGRDQLKIRIIRVSGGATNISSDSNYSACTQLRVSALRKDAAGVVISGTATYANDYVLAHEVVTDALWHFPTAIDALGAEIDTTFTHQIDQLCYSEPVSFQEVLEDLALLEPDMLWEVLESGPDGHKFRLRRLTDEVRYLADARDGWTSPGSDADLRNAVTVAWRDREGDRHSETYTADDVRALDQWGLIRDAELVELGEEVGSLANANRIGPAILAATNNPPAAGTLTVTEPVHDTLTGQDVMPWEIQPGYLIDIADVDIGPLPITQRVYQGSAATLTCGEPVLTQEQLINKLARRRTGR